MRNLIFLLACLFFTQISKAQWNQNMRIGEWKISVTANQFTAKTTMELQFCNDANSGDAENIYSFKLQPHQAVTHFELMLGDTYRDGSIEERWKAVNTYNSIVGKRIDPAVLQKSYPNQYTLNVYPVAAKGCRKVRITIEEKLQIENEVLVYSLPLFSYKSISNFDVKFETTNKVYATTKGIFKNKNISNNVIALTDTYNSINDSVYVRMHLEPTSICVSEKDSLYYFAYRNNTFQNENQIVNPKKVAVFFDVSMASANLDWDLYFDFLKNYLEQNQITTFNAVAFNQEPVFEVISKANNLKALKNRILDTRFVGASNLNLIANYKNVDAILLFSKGTSNYATINQLQHQIPIFAIVPEKEVYQINNLNQLVTTTGGQVITIHKDRLGNALAKSNIVKQKINKVFINGNEVPFQIIDTAIGKYEYLFVKHNQPIQNCKIMLSANGKDITDNFEQTAFCNTNNLDKIDVLNEYQLLEKNRNNYQYNRWNHYYQDNYWARALSFGRTNKIITEQTAYLVLERIEDYINYGITPPKEIEQLVINDPRYVKQTYRDPYKWDAANREKQNLESAINYFNGYSGGFNLAQYKSKADIALDKVKTEPLQIGYAGNDTRSGNSFSNSNSASATLKFETKSEEAVVVVGYATTAKRHMTSSSTVFSADQIQNTSSINNLLAGRVAGVQVGSYGSSALYGNRSSISIRGTSSLNGNNEPLYIVDGVIVENPFEENMINPNDIESVTVLKDINASVLYGSRAVNGAIVIKSKNGSSNKNRTQWTTYNLYSMEDVDYLTELRDAEKNEIWETYTALKKDFGHTVNYYIDAADVFYKYHNTKDAKNILLSALEIATNNSDILLVAYALDEYGWYDEARNVYEKIATTDISLAGNMYRNIGITYWLQNRKQDAANAYYKAISNYGQYNNYDNKNILLEFNALLQTGKGMIDTSDFEIVYKMIELPTKHVTVESTNNASYYINLTKAENKTSNYYNYGKIKVYDFKTIENKTEQLEMKCYGYNSDYLVYARVIEFENFGTSKQQIKIATHNCTGQYGNVILQKIKY